MTRKSGYENKDKDGDKAWKKSWNKRRLRNW